MSSSILETIVANKKRELAERKSVVDIEQLTANLAPSTRSLSEALSNTEANFIFECKKASPSKGLLRESYDLDEILQGYKRFASAISVLTDYHYFKGSFEHLTYVSQNVSQPVLCKDFFIEPYQVYEARFHGADAILLMLSVLSDSEYQKLANVANGLKLDILTEVHDSDEIQRAIQLDAKIIGINNRNLKDLSINLNTTRKLIGELTDEQKQDRFFISESGIYNNAQVKQIAPLVDGFLVGSSIMEKSDIAAQCKSLIFGRVKICGLTNQKAALVAEQSGAIYGGLIFYQRSPRAVNLEQAKNIVSNSGLDFVAVFVNQEIAEIADLVSQLAVNIIQLHGDEGLAYIQSLKQRLPDCEIWKAVKISHDFSQNDVASLAQLPVDRLLLDSYDASSVGGSGKVFDWKNIELFANHSIILAGGLNIKNIQQAASNNTFALDINSGVETSPGEKSLTKIASLFEKLHA